MLRTAPLALALALAAFCLSVAAPASAQESRRVVLIFISAPNCGCNEMAGFANAIARAKETLSSRAVASGHEFSAVGIALTSDPQEGMDYLLRGVTPVVRVSLGPWDEVSAGNGWHSEFAVQRIWGGEVPARFPQILVLERRHTTTEAGIIYGPERMLHRLEGADAITAWVAAGATLP